MSGMLQSGDFETFFQEPNVSYNFLGSNKAVFGKTQKSQIGNVLRSKVAGEHTFIFHYISCISYIYHLYVDVVKDFTDNRAPDLWGNYDFTSKPEFAELASSYVCF